MKTACLKTITKIESTQAHTQPTQLPLISLKKKNIDFKFNNQKKFYVILYKTEVKIEFCLIDF